jgi:hypothetical protein
VSKFDLYFLDTHLRNLPTNFVTGVRYGIRRRLGIANQIFFTMVAGASVIVGALLMAAGGIIALLKPAMLVSPDDQINRAAHVYAGYLVSRNLALAVMLLVALVMPARRMLSCLMVLTAIIQLLMPE